MITNPNKFLLSTLLTATFASGTIFANESDNLVKSIMKLRGEVEALYTQIDDNKDMHKSQMKSYTMQIADGEAQINRQETALKLVESNLVKVKEKISKVSNKNEDIKPLLFTALDNLESTIKAGIPFKIKERTAEIQKIRTQLKDGVITPEKALLHVWSSHDDAIRLTKENGLFKQQILVNGKEKLCQIAKLGSVAMYFATPDESVGYVVKTDSGYEYKVTHDESEKKSIVALFDALQKQIRTGYFTLPFALIAMEKK